MKKLYYCLLLTLICCFYFTNAFANGSNSVAFFIDPPTVVASTDEICGSGNVTLTATGTGTIEWFDNAAGSGQPLHTGNTYPITGLSTTTTYFARGDDGMSEGVRIIVHPLPNVSFSFDNDNTCSGTAIHFTSNVSGGTGPYTYLWDFGDGDTSTSANPTHSFTASGCGSQNFNVELRVTDMECNRRISDVVTVKRRPHVALEDQNIFSPFSNCENNPTASNPSYTIVLNNTSQDNSCINSYNISWGNGQTQNNLHFSDFPLTYTYTQLGAFDLTITAVGGNGCNNSQTYEVANQSNPAGSLGTLGSTTGLCAPATVPFTIGNWELNSPGTQYILDYGDGTSETYNHPLASSTINHIYRISSCPAGSFTATLNVVNSCDSTPYTAGNIQVRIKPVAAFTNPTAACAGTSVCFTNTTVVGSSGANCSPLTVYRWDFGDPTSSTNIVTANGSNNPNACHVFSAPGTYTVTLTTTNPCDSTTFTNTICIESPLPSASFTLNNTTGCNSVTAQATNTTPTANTCNVTYNWSIAYTTSNCGTQPANTHNYFTNGTTATSVNPSFNFPNPGTYTVTLTASNSCSPPRTATQTVTVKAPPTATIAAISSVCGGTSAAISPTATVGNCGSQAPTYLWSFPGGTPLTSTSASPGPIAYSTSGIHNITLDVTNECGTTRATQSFTVTPTVIANAGQDVSSCAGAGSTTLIGVGSGGSGSGYTYSWLPATGLSNAGIANPIASPTSTTTYRLTVSNGQCSGTDDVTIFVNTLTAGTVAGNQTICSTADPVAFTVATAANGAGALTYQWQNSLDNSTFANITGSTTDTFDPPVLGQTTYYRRIATSTLNGLACQATGNVVAVTINTVTAGTIAGDQTICTGGNPATFTASAAATGSGTLSYQWQSSSDGVTFSVIGGATASTYTPPALTQTTYYQRVATSTFNGIPCSVTGNTIIVTVVPDPTVTLLPTATQTLCAGAAATGLTVTATGGTGTYVYQWYSSDSPTGGSPVNGATTSTFTPPATIVGTKYYYCFVTTSASGCNATSSAVQVIVTPAPTISTQPSSGNVCINGTIAPLTVAYSNGTGVPTYQWYSNNTNSTVGGVALSGQTGTTYQPPTASAGITYYYAIITFPSGGCSLLTSGIATITVSALPSVTTQPTATQSICVGGNSTPLSIAYTGGSGTASYQWYSNTTNTTIGGTVISGATAATYTPAAFTTAGNYYYYAIVTLSDSGCGAAISNTATVNVLSDPVIIAQPQVSQSLCANSAPVALTVTANGGVGTLNYQWYSNTANNTTGGTLITGATASSYTPLTNTVGTTYYYCEVSTTTSGCLTISTTATVIVLPSPTFTAEPQSGTVCTGATITPLTVAYINGTGTASYQWFSATTATGAGQLITNETSANYTPPATNAGTTYYYAVVTFSSGGCSSIISARAEIVVHPDPVISTQPEPTQTVCVGGSIPALSIAYTNGFGTPSYQWYSNTNNTTTGGNLINGATATTYTPPAYTATGTYYYYAVVTLSGNGCGDATSNPATVNVVADPVISTQPIATQSLCQNAAATALTFTASGGFGTLSYQWYRNNSANTTGGTAISGETSATYTPSSATVGTQYYYAIVTATGSGCEAASTVSEVITLTSPFVSTQPQPQTICSGQSTTLLSVAYTNGTGTPTYQWYANTIDSNSGGQLIALATAATYQPPADITGTVYYYSVITFASGGCSSISSATAAVTITALPSVTTQQTQTICSEGTFSVTPANGNGNTVPASTQYTWAAPTGTGFTGGSAQTTPVATISQAIINTTNATVTATYQVTPVANGCSGTAFPVTITINPKPVIPNQIQTACSGDAFTVSPVNSGATIVPAGTTYSWPAPVVTGGLTGGIASSANSTSITGTLTNPTNADQTATYTVTPTWTIGSETCTGTTFTVTVTVKPKPVITNMAQTACSGAAFLVTPANGTDGVVPTSTTYSWTAPAAQVGVNGLLAGNGSNINGNITNTNTAPITITYVVTPVSNSCIGATFNVVLTVEPTPTVTIVQNQTKCNGDFTDAITFNGSVTGTIFNWTNNTPSIGLAASGSGNIAAFETVNTGNNPVTATITVTPQLNSCDGTPQIFIISVNPAPTVSFSIADQTICSSTASTAVNLTSSTTGTTITWTVSAPAGISGAATGTTSTTIPAQTLINSTSAPLTVTYIATAITADASACPGAPVVYSITVTPVPFVNTLQQTTICSGTTLNYIPNNTGGNNMPAGATFTWTAATGSGFTGGSAQSTSQNSLNPTLVNTTNVPVTATYTVTPHYSGCHGVPFTVEVTVNPTATIPNSTLTLCSGSAFSFDPSTVAAILPAGTTYSWSAPTGNITGGASGSAQTLITGTLTNTSSAAETAIYTITPLSPLGNCAGNPFTLTVTVNPVFAVTSTVSNYNGFQISTAGASDGSISLFPTGGSGTYTYAWTGPNGFTSSAQNVTNLGPGSYSVTITDGLCTGITLPFTLIEPMPLVIAEVLASHINVNCFGQSTGVIEVEITQVSIAPFDYAILLADGTVVEEVLNLTAEDYVFDNLPAGTYNVRVTDANSTVKFVNGIVITQPASGVAITAAMLSDFNGFSISCNGANNGSIDLTLSGGYPGYTYAWTGPNGFTATTEDISGLNPGVYSVIINDTTNACTIMQSYTITEPQVIAFTGTVPIFNGYEVSCFGGTNGSITIAPTGGTLVYSYSWTGPNGFTASTQNLANLAAGVYQLTITDSNGCSAPIQTFTLNQPAAISVIESHINVLCYGYATGAVDVTITGGVTASGTYIYTWTGPNGYTSSSEDLVNIVAGTYNLVATDDNGCTIPLSIIITQQPEIIITPTTTPITCYGANNASISLAITGGAPPYITTWSNLATGIYQDNLAAGDYIITVTDASNCVKVITVPIPEAPVFMVTPVYNNISCHGAHDGSIDLNLVGGIAPVTLVWSDGSTQGTRRNNLPAGTYTATISDSSPYHCQIIRTFTIVEPAALAVSANITHALDCDDTMSGAINLLVAGGTPPFTFNWSNGSTTEDLTAITSGTYNVNITDSRGCTASGTYTITRPAPITLTVTEDISFNCQTQFVQQVNTAQAAGGVPPFTYTWTSGTVSGNNGQHMTTNQNGTVIVTATDSKGCTATQNFDVATQQLGEASYTFDSYGFANYRVYSVFDAVHFTNTSTGDFIEASWDFGDGSVSVSENAAHTYVREGTYTVTLTLKYPYGCVSTFRQILEVTKGYDVMVPNAFTPNGDGTNDTFSPVYKGLKSLELNVYDTWGSLIYYEKGEVIKGWDGNLKKITSENGNFYYRISVETFYGQIINFEGPFVLLK